MTGGLVLASTSPYRREQLERLGLPFRCQAPLLDEEDEKRSFFAQRTATRESGDSLGLALARHLARAKAQSVRSMLDSKALIIAGDQCGEVDDRILGKPGSHQRNCAQILSLSGRDHHLWTAICVIQGDRMWEHVDHARLSMRVLTPEQVDRYIQADQPWDCAGGYKLERRGISLFQAIACEDHTAITGLPLIAVTRILQEAGIEIP